MHTCVKEPYLFSKEPYLLSRACRTARTHSHTHIRAHTHKHTHTQTHTHTNTHTHTHTHTGKQTHKIILRNSRTHTHTQKRTNKRALRNIRTHSETYTHTRAHTHVNIFVYTRKTPSQMFCLACLLSLASVWSVLFEIMVQIKQKSGHGVKIPHQRSLWCCTRALTPWRARENARTYTHSLRNTHTKESSERSSESLSAQGWRNRTLVGHEPLRCSKMCFTKPELVQW